MILLNILLSCIFAIPAFAVSQIQQPLIISYESDASNMGKNILTKQLSKLGYAFKILGEGDTWRHHGQAITAINNYLKTLDPERIVIIIDARDVLPMRPAHELKTYIEQLIQNKQWATNTVMIGREFFPAGGVATQNYFYPGELFKNNSKAIAFDHIPWWRYPLRLLNKFSNYAPKAHWIQQAKISAQHPWRKESDRAFINTGWYLAKVKVLQKLYDTLKATDNDLDDQHLISDLYYHHPEYFTLDEKRALVYHCSPNLQKLPGEWIKNRWYHNHGEAPFFTHFLWKNYAGYYHTFKTILAINADN